MPGVSPGVVKDCEFLLREIFNPEHIKDGNLQLTAISLKDLRLRGFSVHRMEYVPAERIKASIETRLSIKRNNEPWKNEGVAKFQALKVRQIKLDDQQLFVVIDTALKDNPGHASIFAAQTGKPDSYMRELRSLLLPLLETRTAVDEAFGCKHLD